MDFIRHRLRETLLFIHIVLSKLVFEFFFLHLSVVQAYLWGDIFPSSSTIPSILFVPTTTTAAGTVIDVLDGSDGRDSKGEALSSYSISATLSIQSSVELKTFTTHAIWEWPTSRARWGWRGSREPPYAIGWDGVSTEASTGSHLFVWRIRLPKWPLFVLWEMSLWKTLQCWETGCDYGGSATVMPFGLFFVFVYSC